MGTNKRNAMGICSTPDAIKGSECAGKIYHYAKLELIASILLLVCALMMFGSGTELAKRNCWEDESTVETNKAIAEMFNVLGQIFMTCFIGAIIMSILAHCGAAKKSKCLLIVWTLLMTLLSGGVLLGAAYPAIVGGVATLYCRDTWGYTGVEAPSLPGRECCQCNMFMDMTTSSSSNSSSTTYSTGGTSSNPSASSSTTSSTRRQLAGADCCEPDVEKNKECAKDRKAPGCKMPGSLGGDDGLAMCPSKKSGELCINYEATHQVNAKDGGEIQCVSHGGTCWCGCKDHMDFLCQVAVPSISTGTILMVIVFLLYIVGTFFGYCICCCGKDKDLFNGAQVAVAAPVNA